MKKILSYLIYWLIQCTWGLLMTSIGAVAALVLLVTGHKPKALGPAVYFEIGESWGGINLGPFFICSKDACDLTKKHEFGHSIQNMIWGPLMPFIIGIPSLIRSMLRRESNRLKKSLFNLFYLLITLAFTTFMAFIFFIFYVKWLIIFFEILRIYFLLVSIWLTIFEIPKYDYKYVSYDSIWFEGQATKIGNEICQEKKED